MAWGWGYARDHENEHRGPKDRSWDREEASWSHEADSLGHDDAMLSIKTKHTSNITSTIYKANLAIIRQYRYSQNNVREHILIVVVFLQKQW